MLKTEPKPPQDEVIGYCPGCDQPISEGQPNKLVLGQLFHTAHAPRAEKWG
ncbi:MAG: hypothetical protein LAN63_07185 [Acidobacteriia bacterium]|nr:hypothetical protein [Terriglobia bacterium]